MEDSEINYNRLWLFRRLNGNVFFADKTYFSFEM